MVGAGDYSDGSKMPTVLSAPATTVGSSPSHRKREDAVLRWALVQAPSSDHLEHPPAGELADRSGCGLPVDPGPIGNVAKRGTGGTCRLRIAIQDEPDRQLGPGK